MNVSERLLTLTMAERLLVCMVLPASIVFVPFVLGMFVRFLCSIWNLTNNFYLGDWGDCLDTWCTGFNTLFLTSLAWIYILFA